MPEISPYLWAIIMGWVIAQGAKYIVVVFKTRSFGDFRQLYISGNMPSAHSATALSLVTVVALKDGLDSGVFGVAALFAGVVMYDAMMVRRSVGEQGLALRQLIRAQKSPIELPRAAKGHTPVEVAIGALLGVLIGSVVFFATN